MQHKDNILITKIINEIEFAVKRIENMSQDDFMNDIDAQHSVGMAVINVGELIKHISDDIRKDNPDISWKEAAGFRDVAAHSYDTINMDDLYITIKEDFPDLKVKMSNLQTLEKCTQIE